MLLFCFSSEHGRTVHKMSVKNLIFFNLFQGNVKILAMLSASAVHPQLVQLEVPVVQAQYASHIFQKAQA